MSQLPVVGSVYKKVQPYFGKWDNYDQEGLLISILDVEHDARGSEVRIWFKPLVGKGVRNGGYLPLPDFYRYFSLPPKSLENILIKEISVVNGELV